MKWYKGNIAEAVSLAKTNNALFVVFIYGNDDLSRNFRSLIEDERITSKLENKSFVSIEIGNETESFRHFNQIYQLVPTPSLFFIGENGLPLDILTSAVSSVEVLEEKILKVVEMAGLSLTSQKFPEPTSKTPSENMILNERRNSSSNAFDEDKNLVGSNSKGCGSDFSEITQTQEIENATKVKEIEKAKQILEEKRKAKEEEETKLQKKIEIERRKQGKDMQNFKKMQQKQEIEELQKNIKRERLEEQEARQKILEKIANDQAERKQKYSNIEQKKDIEKASTSAAARSTVTSNNEHSRIQFKKPNGESTIYTFKSDDKFLLVREYVKNNLLSSSEKKEFLLATAYPKREFISIDDSKTLQELGLCPSAVLLIILAIYPPSGPSALIAHSGGYFGMVYTLFSSLLTPVYIISGYLRNMISGRNDANAGAQKRANDENIPVNNLVKRRNLEYFDRNNAKSEAKNTTTSDKTLIQRNIGGSNIHRLRDTQDSDDENNTWNGNSTQQQ